VLFNPTSQGAFGRCFRTAALVVTLLAMAALVLSTGFVAAQDAPQIEPRAAKILKVMSGVLTDAEQFSVHNEQTSDERTDRGDLVELASTVDLSVRRPGQAHAVLHGDLQPIRYWIGGGEAVMLDVTRWTYAIASVPEDLGDAVDRLWDAYGVNFPLADFVTNHMYDDLIRDVETGAYVGLHEVDGVPCHHLAFKQADIDWQIWVEDGIRPLPRKLTIVYKTEPGAPRYTARFSNWDLSPGLGNTVFDFEPPEGAERIEFAGRSAGKGE